MQEQLEKVRVLGEGTYGKCFLVRVVETGELCVLKQIEIAGLSEAEVAESLREAHILEALDSDFIIRFLRCFQTDGHLNILMAFAEGGDLSHRIRQARLHDDPLPEPLVLRWFTQLCLALKHVHDRKIIHRDLKAQNVFLTGEGNVKLGDFGIARHLQLTAQKTKTVVGTPYYMSPEICENREYSFKADIWSLGVILLEMCLLRPPFEANSLPVLALKIAKGEYSPLPKHYSRELRRLVAEILQVDPDNRPSIAELLRNQLLQPRIAQVMGREARDREFSHTTLHAINVLQKPPPSRGLFLDCAPDSSPSAIDLASPKSLQPNKNHDLPVKRIDNYTKDPAKPKKEKVDKKEMRKREFSEPTLTPKGHVKVENERKLFGKNNSSIVAGKKQPKESLFKKKSRNVDIIEEMEEINSIKKDIREMMHGGFSHRPEEDPPALAKEDLDSDEEEELHCPVTDRLPPEPTPKADPEETLLETLEALIGDHTNHADLRSLYDSCSQNAGICLIGPCAGLVTLAHAIRNA